jgi:hypothetical protein
MALRSALSSPPSILLWIVRSLGDPVSMVGGGAVISHDIHVSITVVTSGHHVINGIRDEITCRVEDEGFWGVGYRRTDGVNSPNDARLERHKIAMTGKAVNASEVDRTHETENLSFTGSAFRFASAC